MATRLKSIRGDSPPYNLSMPLDSISQKSSPQRGSGFIDLLVRNPVLFVLILWVAGSIGGTLGLLTWSLKEGFSVSGSDRAGYQGTPVQMVFGCLISWVMLGIPGIVMGIAKRRALPEDPSIKCLFEHIVLTVLFNALIWFVLLLALSSFAFY